MNCRFYGFLLFQTLWNRQSCAKWAEACFNRLSCGQKISKTIKPSQAAKPFGQRTGMSFCSSNNQKYYDNLLLWGLYLCIISRCNINIYIHTKNIHVWCIIYVYIHIIILNNVNIYIYACPELQEPIELICEAVLFSWETGLPGKLWLWPCTWGASW